MKRGCLAALYMMSRPKPIMNFEQWKFHNPPNYAALPIDHNPKYNEPVAVKNAIFSKLPTEPLEGTIHLVCVAEDALIDLLDLDPSVVDTKLFKDFINGSYLPEGGLVVAHRYGGYQFGFWADQLGDGRAHILGEYVNRSGTSWQLQLKGSGETPYSRFGDGRAVLRSSIREMIASEACYHLGIPTTRAVALVASDEHKVWRNMAHSGCARQERTAIVMRLAPAWYRIGSLEILVRRREPENLKLLVDFIIEKHFSELTGARKYVDWFKEVVHRTLVMLATWQGTGFTHGVLNTDNISLLGLTIDYGPYGFMDHYRRHYIPNTSDSEGRYAFARQPQIVLWNLEKFADALEPLLFDDEKEIIKNLMSNLHEKANEEIVKYRLKKLGLSRMEAENKKLVENLLTLMELKMADFTGTFRQLSEVDITDLLNETVLETKWSLKKISGAPEWAPWVKKYQESLELEDYANDDERREKMLKVNPLYVPRNWILQEAIQDAEKNEFEKVRFLLKLFQNPFDVNDEAERRGYSDQPPSWSYGIKLNCSS